MGVGGIRNDGALTIRNSEIRDNTSFDRATGGILSNGTLSITPSLIGGNTGSVGTEV